MTSVDRTTPGQGEAISFEFELLHAPQKVWRALTEPALLAEWLLPIADLALEQGARFNFSAPPQPGWDGVVQCTMLSIEPHKSLSYSWTVGDLDTVVTFSLTPTAAGTRLSLQQSGFKPDQKRNFGGARYGWRMMGDRLIGVLATMT